MWTLLEDLKNWKAAESVSEIFLTVVIPTLNEEDHIRGSVSSAISRNVEVIVVDGGSTDDTSLGPSPAGARTIENLLGRALQQNRGAAFSRGENLLFLHADTRLPKGYLAEVFEILMAQGSGAGCLSFQNGFSASLHAACGVDDPPAEANICIFPTETRRFS
jgi:glycosyltransferase involved in cell wall biosynthesis